MAIENEELMEKLVRTGMIMRHIDGEGPHGHGHGHGHHKHGEKCECKEEHDEKCECKEGHGNSHGNGHGKGKCSRRRGQMRVISMISLQEGINQKELAFLLGIRPQTLGEMLRKLEEHNLIERKKSPEDARVIQLYLTEGGRNFAAEIAERRKLAAADLFSALTDAEKEQLSTILDKLGAELDKYRPKHCKHRKEKAAQE